MIADARVNLGISVDEFWDLTPCQLGAYYKAYDDKLRRDDYRFGVLCYVVRRVAGDKRAKPTDFFGRKGDKQKTRAQEAAELRDNIVGAQGRMKAEKERRAAIQKKKREIRRKLAERDKK
ncbi:MAG: hypothetical protein GTN64_05475 [Candidatus Latescibacteria bacterium]|nr:hypothetical protein [Candidatus Latescibacterota bacterium]NIO78060.1 hypothetical protein [Candidatus Latescibacterota bacterium]